MKLKISKIDDDGKTELYIRFVTPKGENEFDYIKLIEHLYHNPSEEVELSYSENITEEEKTKIQEMFDEIKKESQQNIISENTENPIDDN